MTTAPLLERMARLFAPLSPTEFFEDVWEIRPFLSRTDDLDRFADLPDMAELWGILQTIRLSRADFRVVRDGATLQPPRLFEDREFRGAPYQRLEVRTARQQYLHGGTLVFEALDDHHVGLGRLCRSISWALDCPVQANVYLSPPGSRGFQRHYDTHDVFVVQLDGRKDWAIFDAPLPLPLKTQPFEQAPDPSPEPDLTITLRRGDVLYIPRGHFHSAATTDTASAHVAIGCLPRLWSDLAAVIVKQVAHRVPELRRALPAGWRSDPTTLRAGVDRLIATCLADLPDEDLQAAVKTLGDDLQRQLVPEVVPPPGADGDRDPIAKDTMVAIPAGVRWTLTATDSGLQLDDGTVSLTMPPRLRAALERMVRMRAFSAASLTRELDPASGLVLIRRLVKEGALVVRTAR